MTTAQRPTAPSTVTLIPGDGIGKEIAPVLQSCVAATGAPIIWESYDAGESAVAQGLPPLPQELLESIRRNKVAIKGPTGTPIGTQGHRSVNVGMRRALDLFACVRPFTYYPGVPTRIKDPEGIDFTIIRENTEDLYAGIEFAVGEPSTESLIREITQRSGERVREDSAIAIKPISITGSDRIVRYAFDYAREHGKTRVTAVTKANIMKLTDGLVLERARAVARDYPEIQLEEMLVDNANMQITARPERFQVIVTPNLYGDILSDHAAAVVGGLGVAPGANIGDDYALFEAVHGTAPDIAGKGLANPTALLLSGAMMLRHLGYTREGDNLERAVADTLKEGTYVTGDIKRGAGVSTTDMGEAIERQVRYLRNAQRT